MNKSKERKALLNYIERLGEVPAWFGDSDDWKALVKDGKVEFTNGLYRARHSEI